MIFRGELDSGVEIGVRNPAHGQIWAFVGTTFHLSFLQHRVNSKKFCAPEKICPASHFLRRKLKKTLLRTFIDVILHGEWDSGKRTF